MYITKPLGCTLQLIGIVLGVAGIGMIPQGGSSTFFGIIFLPLAAWIIWRGGRRPERKAEINR